MQSAPLLLQQYRSEAQPSIAWGVSGRNLEGMYGLARMLVRLGLLLLIAAGVVYLLDRIGISFGRLPGDFAWRRKGVSVYFPLGTSILLSLLLTLILYLIERFRR